MKFTPKLMNKVKMKTYRWVDIKDKKRLQAKKQIKIQTNWLLLTVFGMVASYVAFQNYRTELLVPILIMGTILCFSQVVSFKEES